VIRQYGYNKNTPQAASACPKAACIFINGNPHNGRHEPWFPLSSEIIMKIAKIMVLWAALAGSAFAAGLDQYDAGDYVMLDKDQRPTHMQQRYYQRGTQWVMDAKQGDSEWAPVCRGTGECRLQTSPAQKVREWKALLPAELQAMPMACIHNKAFAFCRMSKPDNPNMRLYWWFAWRNGQTYALRLNRVR